MNIRRIGRISEEVKKVVSDIILNNLKDPRVSNMTTVTNVEVTRDLSYARIFISVLGDDQDKQDTLDGLESAKGYIRSEISKNVDLRHVPKPVFLLDESIEKGMHISKLIKDLNREKDEENE